MVGPLGSKLFQRFGILIKVNLQTTVIGNCLVLFTFLIQILVATSIPFVHACFLSFY